MKKHIEEIYAMFGSLYDDMEFIENKYHKTSEPFDPYRRMYYHGYEYDAATGLDDEEMRRELDKLAKEYAGLPHPVAKAKLFEFLLENARIDVNPRDWFVGFYNWGRLLWDITVTPRSDEVFSTMPEISEKMKLFNSSGAVSSWPDFDHVIPDWDNLLKYGFGGLLKRAEEYHRKKTASGITEKQEAFYTGIEITYRAIIGLIDRYYKYALTKSGEKSKLQAECLKNLRDGAPETLYEALQAMYIFFILCECVDNYQTRSLGNGIDSTLCRFYRSDTESGKYTKDEERTFLAYFFMQFSAIGNYWGHPMYMGGTNYDGTTRYNELSEEILDIYGELKIYNPKVQIKVAENTPRKILYKVFDLQRKGISSFVFCCEPGYKKAIMGYGATEKEAIYFEISGCYETKVRGGEVDSSVAYVNAPKAIEYVFTRGVDANIGKKVGIDTGDINQFVSFEDFYTAFIRQWEYLIEESIKIGNAYEGYFDVINPSNVFSGANDNALKSGADGYCFGQKYKNSCILNCGFASAVDSVMAVKKLCFDEKLISLSKMKKALENDWNGYESIRSLALKLPNKYGNGDAETDCFASAMADYFSGKINNRPNARNGVYKACMHSAMQFVWQGAKTGALPDGRKSGEELSKNASPVNGMDKSGATALIKSAIKLNPSNYHTSFCVDVMLHPSATEGQEGLIAMYSLLMTYLKNDGMAIQFNIFNADVLRDAQKNPEKYRNLQVRVCGWNVLWNNLSRAEQEAYILRAESIG